MDFIENCLRPDMMEGTMGRIWYVRNAAYYDTNTSWIFTIYLERAALDVDGEPATESESVNFRLQLDAERCMEWVSEHTDADIQPVRVTSPKDVPDEYR